ncbi:RteC domain-containing protein [Aequorivita marina]|uniref:RteC domain-containing protein n=1 Tax=Aequorivita marina TaxID=3073654 RepID=UPI002874CACC|nr:RteC domain-containing protein [Aequorivita sp. S2608]MDS1297872.1 RteC domain-containing protein [Aequorivita sp. S2608]
MEYCTKVIARLERNIHKINSESNTIFEEIEIGVIKSQLVLQKLRKKILSDGFLSTADECLFFKSIKPKPLGYLIYYLNLAEYETNRPKNTLKKVRKYIQDHIANYQNYCREHKFFYQYLERKRTDKDKQYFLRTNRPVKFHPDSLSYCIDKDFSTSHDFIAAKIFAHKLLINRLKNDLKVLENPPPDPEPKSLPHLQWTSNKVDLIELIYALYESGAINNGNSDIKEIATIFQHFLNINLGDYYRTYIEIRSRKTNQTNFLDRIKNSLVKRINQAYK